MQTIRRPGHKLANRVSRVSIGSERQCRGVRSTAMSIRDRTVTDARVCRDGEARSLGAS